MPMKISIAYSPCPNDTFIFEPLIHGRIPSKNIDWEVHLHDVEELNNFAKKGTYDVTKLSYYAYAHLSNKYQMLSSGSALGHNCGPILIAREDIALDRISELKIAIPGLHTTAYFLLKNAFPDIQRCEVVLFSDIEEAVSAGKYDAGLIIHESRFTFREKGLVQIIDLGEYWERTTGLPIPLGGIAVKRDLPDNLKLEINNLLRQSVEYAMNFPESGLAYIRAHAQEMDDQVMKSHIQLYVNEYTRDLGENGKSAVNFMIEKISEDVGNMSSNHISLFVDNKQ